MLVRELIEELLKCDQEQEVFVQGCYGSTGDVFDVSVDEADNTIWLDTDLCSG